MSNEMTDARALADEYRPSMDLEVLHSWAAEAAARLRGEAAQGEQQAVAGYVYPEHLKLNGPDWGPAALYHEKRHKTIPLYTHPQPTAVADMPPKGKPFVGCQCPSCGEEFAASAAPAPVAGEAVWSDEAAHAFRCAADAVGAHWHSWPDRFRAGMKAAIAAAPVAPTTK